MSNKLLNWILSHQVIYALILFVIVYPLYLGLAYVWAALLPIIHNAITNDNWRLGTSILPQMLIFAAIPWITKVLFTIPAIKKPFGKYGNFYSRKETLIDVISVMTLPTFIEIIYINEYGTFMVSNYLAMAIIVALGHIIGLILNIYKLKKLNRRLKEINW